MSRRKRIYELLGQILTRPVGKPNFLVIGGVKCGTYSLYRYLSKHTNVVTARKKEVGYFNNDARYQNEKWYLKQFRAPRWSKLTKDAAIGEFTPSYCFSPCIERIAQFDVNMKLIMMVRDPVARAISQYNMYVRHGLESRDIAEALLSDDGENPHLNFAYLTRGRYHEQIVNIQRHFDASNLLIKRLEDLAHDPRAVMGDITKFLNIEPLTGVQYVAHNAGQYQSPDGKLIEKLAGYFAPWNEKLQKDYGIEINDWT